MQNFTPELIAKAKSAKSAEELLELAKENDIALTETQAQTYFEQLHANAAVSDDELEAVSGGGAICAFFEDLFSPSNKPEEGTCQHCSDKTAKLDKPIFDNSLMPTPFDPTIKNKIEHL